MGCKIYYKPSGFITFDAVNRVQVIAQNSDISKWVIPIPESDQTIDRTDPETGYIVYSKGANIRTYGLQITLNLTKYLAPTGDPWSPLWTLLELCMKKNAYEISIWKDTQSEPTTWQAGSITGRFPGGIASLQVSLHENEQKFDVVLNWVVFEDMLS